MNKVKQLTGVFLLLLFVLSGCASIEKAEALHRGGEKQEALEMAIGLLDDDSPKVRLRAVKLIGKIGSAEAGVALHSHLNDPSSRVNNQIIRTLGMLQYEPALEDLGDLVPNADADTIRSLADAFQDYGKKGVDMIVARYDSPSQSSHRGAYKEVLIRIGPEIADSVINLLKGRSYFDNRDTFDILQRIKNPRVASLMLPYLSDEEVADQVIEAMKRLGSNAIEATILALEKQRKDGETLVTVRLIRILGLLKAKQGIEILESYSQHDDDRIRNAIEHSLFQIRGF